MKILSVLTKKTKLINKDSQELDNILHCINIFFDFFSVLLEEFNYNNLFKSVDDCLVFFHLLEYNHYKTRFSQQLLKIL
jgi:hypothetical protein